MKIAIAGYGKEGKVNYDYWNTPGSELTIVDEHTHIDAPANARTMLGENVFSQLDGFDIVVRTAGLRPDKIHTNGKVWSATNEFFAKCPAQIIGVTGTKGKGTTCSLITSILQAAGKTVHLVGNIGVAGLSELPNIKPDDIVVYELSSFQLWDIEKSPHVAVLLKIEQDHLDVHRDMDEYVKAKANITRFMNHENRVFFHPTYEYSRTAAYMWKEQTGVQPKRYGSAEDGTVYVANGMFTIGGTTICSTAAMQIPGEHNIENACAAISACLEYTQDYKAIEQGLRSFSGLPHRLKFVREVDSVSYYDDSIATTPGSAIAALKTFKQPKVLILGGKDKGADYLELVELCKATDTKIIAVGSNATRITELCDQLGVAYEHEPGNMQAIVAKAHEVALPGAVVLLSPSAASFDMFTSYSDRGDQFIAAVSAL